MVAATESTAVRSFGREQPELEGDLGLENSNGVLWLTAAEAVDFDLPVASSKRKKSKEEPKRAACRTARLLPADALRGRGLHNALTPLASLALVGHLGLGGANRLLS